MSLFVVDVESDGPVPPLFSMVSFGVVLVDQSGKLDKTFYGQTKPISERWNPEALAISSITREQHLSFDEPYIIMHLFKDWLQSVNTAGNPTFISDNPAFDWQWINYYTINHLGKNPFGFSARRIGDLYCGLVKDASKNSEWKKKFRKTKHVHHPVDDARGNAEAILAMRDMGLKINL